MEGGVHYNGVQLQLSVGVGIVDHIKAGVGAAGEINIGPGAALQVVGSCAPVEYIVSRIAPEAVVVVGTGNAAQAVKPLGFGIKGDADVLAVHQQFPHAPDSGKIGHGEGFQVHGIGAPVLELDLAKVGDFPLAQVEFDADLVEAGGEMDFLGEMDRVAFPKGVLVEFFQGDALGKLAGIELEGGRFFPVQKDGEAAGTGDLEVLAALVGNEEGALVGELGGGAGDESVGEIGTGVHRTVVQGGQGLGKALVVGAQQGDCKTAFHAETAAAVLGVLPLDGIG